MTAIVWRDLQQLDFEIEYPDTDGQPMAESDFQRPYLAYSTEVLGIYFKARSNVYVSGNLFIYYEKGNPKAVVAPDTFVVFGVANHPRRSYKLWEEDGKVPSFVLEITSYSTVSEDQGTKKGLYAFLGIAEYFQYDPTGDYLTPKLQGFRLTNGSYETISSTTLANEQFAIASSALGLELRLEGDEMRFYDPASGQKLLSHAEAEAARQQAELRADQAVLRADQAELEAEQQRQRADRLATKLREMGIDLNEA
jgi:Uma2 family endonuclease